MFKILHNQDFLNEITSDSLLVYADWLEETGDAIQANMIRIYQSDTVRSQVIKILRDNAFITEEKNIIKIKSLDRKIADYYIDFDHFLHYELKLSTYFPLETFGPTHDGSWTKYSLDRGIEKIDLKMIDVKIPTINQEFTIEKYNSKGELIVSSSLQSFSWYWPENIVRRFS
jgi:uncharacterized protein (TIGR02996 family)